MPSSTDAPDGTPRRSSAPNGAVKAVAFDMDGVMTQSMGAHYEAYRRIFAEKGVAIEPHEVYAREGQKAPEVVRFIAKTHGLSLPEAEFDAMARAKQLLFYSFGALPPYPGAYELVSDLRDAGLPVALVTGTWKANALQHLGTFVERFSVIIAADDVTRTKPDPEPYARAFATMGVSPSEGIVVENAVLGIRAGKSAGARVLAVATTLTPDELHEADVVLGGLNDVRAWLRKQGVGV